MGTFTNSEDPDEMPHNAAFLQGLHCLYLGKKSLQTKNTISFKVISQHPNICTMDYPQFIATNQKEESIRTQRDKTIRLP